MDSRIAVVIAGSIVFQEESDLREAVRSILPEGIADRFDVVEWSRQPSSHYTMRLTTDLIDLLRSLVGEGYGGLVVTSGTDVMEEMAYLTDLLWPYPQPVVFTGVSAPARRHSNEGVANLFQAAVVAASEQAQGLGVTICSRGELFAASEAVKVYSHRGNDFQAPGRGPLGEVVQEEFYLSRRSRRPLPLPESALPVKDVELVTASLGGGEILLAGLARCEHLQGLVLAGFGTGNVPPPWIPHMKALLKRDIPIVVTSRCALGRVLSLYPFEASFRRLAELGVLSGGNLRPLQARLRLSVGIGAGLRGKELQDYLVEGCR